MKWLTVLLASILFSHARASDEPHGVKVVEVCEGMARYLAALAENPESDREALWRENVIDPYWSKCAEGGAYIEYAPNMKEPFGDLEGLRASVSALQDSPIQALVRSAAGKSEEILAGPETTVCVFAADSSWTYLLGMHGVGGFTAGAGKVWLTILPSGDWKEWVSYAVAHEYYHSAWTARQGEQDPVLDLGDYLVFEGRADSFARLIESQRHAPWTSALTLEEEQRAWKQVQVHLQSTDPAVMQVLMFGGVNGVSPWTGYTIGFRIVQSFLRRHPELSVSEWTAISADDLLEQAAYRPGAGTTNAPD